MPMIKNTRHLGHKICSWVSWQSQRGYCKKGKGIFQKMEIIASNEKKREVWKNMAAQIQSRNYVG